LSSPIKDIDHTALAEIADIDGAKKINLALTTVG
jgi:hypothetical protein